MMLDNKNEQKWPLTEKEVLNEEQTVKGHFFCIYGRSRQKKNGQPTAAPTYLSYHILNF